ncbi:uncharacterized protein LOC135378175 [Ornithodoros turicata]|uniref:uncharacterized protein LOC135378175 n=1 Tax=Ornithodoros turicata TaxID=34597 RepID=UPI003138964E
MANVQHTMCAADAVTERNLKVNLPHPKVKAGVVYGSPEDCHHICSPESQAEAKVSAKHFERTTREEIFQGTDNRPRETYNVLLQKFVDQHVHVPRDRRADIERHLPMFRSVRSTYQMQLNWRYPVLHGIGDPAETWEGLTKMSEVSRSGAPGSYMILQRSVPPFLAISSDLDLDTLHASHH